MTSVRRKSSSEVLRMPRWLRGPPTSLRTIGNREEASIYRRMLKAVIQELRPNTPIEWILVIELVNAQFSAMRYGTWQAAVMQFSVGEGLKRAVKNRLRTGKRVAKRISIGKHKNWPVACVATSMITPLKPKCTCPDAARWTAFIKDKSRLNVAATHRCAYWNSGAAGSKKTPRKSQEPSWTSETASNLGLLKW